MEKDKLQEVAFNLIMLVGQARSSVLQSMGELAEKKIDRSEFDERMSEASDLLNQAGQEHLSVIQAESSGLDIQHTILLTHAEDLYLTTSTMVEMVMKMVNLFELKK